MGDNTDGPLRKKRRYTTEAGPDLTSKPTLIRVGEFQKEYYIHENILRSNSIFFDNALKKEWKEGQDRVVDLPEANNEAFSIWIKWLYTGAIFLTPSNDKPIDVKESDEDSRWTACYELSNFLQDADFKDACIDLMIELMFVRGKYPSLFDETVYAYSPKGSNHRAFAVDIFVNFCERKEWGGETKHPYHFLRDIVKAIGPNIDSGIKVKTCSEFFNLDDTCKYHDHGPDKPCYKTKRAWRI